MENKRKVQTEEAQQYARDSDIIHMETSAKTSSNVRNLFIEIGTFLLVCVVRFSLSEFVSFWTLSCRPILRIFFVDLLLYSQKITKESNSTRARYFPYSSSEKQGQERMLLIPLSMSRLWQKQINMQHKHLDHLYPNRRLCLTVSTPINKKAVTNSTWPVEFNVVCYSYSAVLLVFAHCVVRIADVSSIFFPCLCYKWSVN